MKVKCMALGIPVVNVEDKENNYKGYVEIFDNGKIIIF